MMVLSLATAVPHSWLDTLRCYQSMTCGTVMVAATKPRLFIFVRSYESKIKKKAASA
jgi:hypothetical protein